MNLSSMNRRRFLQTTAATASTATLGGMLAACGSSSSSSSAKVTLAYWDWWVTQAPWVDGEIALFQKAHPNITIKKTTQGNSTYDTLLPLSFKSKRSPDVFMIPAHPAIGDQITQGWLRPVDDNQWKQQFPKGSFLEGSNMLNGKTFSAPLTGSAPWVQLYINNEVFRQAGLKNADGSIKVPRTWDDVTNAADAITKKSNGSVYGLGFGAGGWNLLPLWVEVFVRGAGSPGGGYDKDLRVGKYTYGSDRNYADFVALLLEWKKRGYFYPDSVSISDETARAFFERGKFGMTVGGVWNQAEWTAHQFTDYTLTTLVGPEAKPKGYFYNSGGGVFAGISKQTKYPDEALAWFKWLYSPEAGRRYVEKGIDVSVYPQNNNAKNVKFPPFAQYVATSTLSIAGPNPKARNPQVAQADAFVKAVKPDLGDTLTGAYTGQVTNVPQALASLEARSQAALEDAVKQAQQKGAKVSLQDYIFSDWDLTRPYTV